jgi:hypothetical protein
MSVLLEMSMGDMNEERTGIFSIFQKGSSQSRLLINPLVLDFRPLTLILLQKPKMPNSKTRMNWRFPKGLRKPPIQIIPRQRKV